MKSLETTFVSGDGGFASAPLTYHQVKRSAKCAIYERSRDGSVKDYEVFIIRVEPKGKILKFPKGITKLVEDDTENYPATSNFGRTAWSFGNLKAAERRFEELDKAENLPEEEEEPEKTFNIPLGEFTVTEFASFNELLYPQAFLFIKEAVENKTITVLREERRALKGKKSKIYAKTT